VPIWAAAQGSGLGDVTGPSGAINNSIARFNSTTGKLIKDGGNSLLDDAGNLSLAGDALVSGDLTVLGDTNLNNVTITGVLTINGPTIRSVASGATPTFTVNSSNYFNAVQSGVTLVLMPASPQLGQEHVIKDIDGVAGTTSIVVNGSGNTIDGASTTTLAADYQSVTLIFGPSEWNLI
jgi:hypothetical protein